MVDALTGAEVIDLGRPYINGMAQSPNHPTFRHCLDRRHGDKLRADGGSAAADLITMGAHVGTHVDALAHVSHDGLLHGGVDAVEAQQGGRFESLGIDELDPVVGRGVLLDVPAALGID
ncbi:MAG: cyclase family protein, partial [Ilumatobacteraceae bacterium]